jgi:hypothetical protein
MANLKIFNYDVDNDTFRIRAHTREEAEKKMKKYAKRLEWKSYQYNSMTNIPTEEYEMQYRIYVSENEVVNNGR